MSAAAVSAAAIALTAACGSGGPATEETPSGTNAGSNAVPAPAAALYFGASAGNGGPRESLTAFQELMTRTGSTFTLHRTYQQWDSAPISSSTRWDGENGIVPVVSVKPRGSWAEVAHGDLDADIVKAADAWRAWGKPALLAFHHEPEDDSPDRGSPQDFVDAWRHYVQVFRDRGVKNVAFAWVMMSTSFDDDASVADSFYPGDAWVDWLGVDAYNWYGCHAKAKWISFAEATAAFREWAAGHHKPVVVAEIGTQEGPGSQDKAQWLHDMMSTLSGWSQVKGLAYYDVARGDCDWRVTSSAESFAAWRSIAGDPRVVTALPHS